MKDRVGKMRELFSLVKERVDIVEVVSRYVELRRVGSSYRGLCPFHFETEPSFYVHPEKKIFKCFGCGEGGDVVKFLARVKGISQVDALAELLEELSLVVRRKEVVKKGGKEEREVKFPEGSIELEKLRDSWLWGEVEDFGERHRVRVEDMLEMKWRWWRGRILIPCWDKERKKLLYWVARAVDDVVEPRYVNCAVEKNGVLWGLDWYRVEEGVLYVCEGWKDAYRMRGVAVLGVQVKESQVERIVEIVREERCSVGVVFDRGVLKRAVELGNRLSEKGVRVFIGVLSELKDPGEAGSKGEVLSDVKFFDFEEDKFELMRLVRITV